MICLMEEYYIEIYIRHPGRPGILFLEIGLVVLLTRFQVSIHTYYY